MMSGFLKAAPARFFRRVLQFRSARAGNVAVIGGLFIAAIIPLAAISIDIGALYLERREMQKLVDLAAITAASNMSKAEKAARLFLEDNGVTNFTVTLLPEKEKERHRRDDELSAVRMQVFIEKGGYAADPGILPENRFDPQASKFDAVKVTIRKRGTLYFGGSLIRPPLIQTVGTAHARTEAAFSVGSRLLRLESGVLNALLNGLLGTNISLDVADYEALVGANVDLLSFIDSLASKLDLSADTYTELLDTDVTVGQFAGIMAEVARGRPAAITALGKIASHKQAGKISLKLADFVDLGPIGNLAVGSGTAALEAEIGALEMLTSAAAIANGGSQVKLDLGLSLPGISELTADLAIGEPEQNIPWLAVGETGTIVRTAQTRLFVEARIGGNGILSGLTVRLPLYLEIAYAEARLEDVVCPEGNANRSTVDIDARPGVAELWIADVDRNSMKRFDGKPRTSKASLIDAHLLRVDGLSHVEIGNDRFSELRFTHGNIINQTAKTVSTRDFTNTLVKSLIGDLSLDIKAGGLTIGSPALIQKALAALLTSVSEPLDNALYNLLAALGVKVGQADIRVHGVKCGRAVLVQ